MLILTRKRDEEVVIETPAGDLIRVVVTDAGWADGKIRVRLGFDAPKAVRIHRKEVRDAIQRGDGK